MNSFPTPRDAVDAAVSCLPELQDIHQTMLVVSAAFDTHRTHQLLSVSEQQQLTKYHFTADNFSFAASQLSLLIRAIEILHEDKVALSNDQCEAVHALPLLMEQCKALLVPLQNGVAPAAASRLLDARTLNMVMVTAGHFSNHSKRLLEIFSPTLVDALEEYDDSFAIRKGRQQDNSSGSISGMLVEMRKFPKLRGFFTIKRNPLDVLH